MNAGTQEVTGEAGAWREAHERLARALGRAHGAVCEALEAIDGGPREWRKSVVDTEDALVAMEMQLAEVGGREAGQTRPEDGREARCEALARRIEARADAYDHALPAEVSADCHCLLGHARAVDHAAGRDDRRPGSDPTGRVCELAARLQVSEREAALLYGAWHPVEWYAPSEVTQGVVHGRAALMEGAGMDVKVTPDAPMAAALLRRVGAAAEPGEWQAHARHDAWGAIDARWPARIRALRESVRG